MQTKYCPDCRADRPVAEFSRDTRRKDGLSFYCSTHRREREASSRRRRLGPQKHRGWLRPSNVPDGHKWCPECGGIKPVAEFPRNRSQRNGYGSYCKPCHNRIGRDHLEKRGGSRDYHLRRRYGITVEHYEQMLAEQNGVCAICKEAPAEHVDHDHATDRVRGLLCFNCNGALGQFRDRTDLMLRAVGYLRPGSWAQLIDNPGVSIGVSVCDETGRGRPDAR